MANYGEPSFQYIWEKIKQLIGGEIDLTKINVNAALSTANQAMTSATDAYSHAQDAETYANQALQAARDAQSDADDAHTAASDAQSAASTAQTWASEARTQATSALTSAQNAQQSADSALISLSNVEDVVGVLEWITAHGTMTANGSAPLDQSKVYFIVDPNGDYVVGGTHYSIVSEPKSEDRTSYYTLSVDESVQNYIATHIVVDTEGLWLIPDSGGNKVLIATGAGSSYTTAGTYIIGKVNGVDTVFARFASNGTQIGRAVGTEDSAFLEAVDMRDSTGIGTVTESWVADGGPVFILGAEAVDTNYTVTVNGSVKNPTKTVTNFTFNPAPTAGSRITATYTTSSNLAKYYTNGLRKSGTVKGLLSFAEGKDTIASGFASHAEGEETEARDICSHAEGQKTKAYDLCTHAEGYNTKANAQYSHAEGYRTTASGISSHAEGNLNVASGSDSHAEGSETVASGRASHAQNISTIANGDAQTVLGKYNVADTTSAVIIGKGTTDNARANALTVDWNGNVNIASGAKYKINGTNLSASDVSAVALTDKYTRSSAGDLNWSSTTEGDAKVIAKSALAFWNGAYSGNSSNLSKCSTGNIIGSNGGTMTGQLKTSFKESVAMGSYGASASTVPNLVEELRFSSGCMGSASIGTAYTKDGITIGTGWYNFIYSPHRSGGSNGSASGDNCDYGNLILMGMTMGGAYLIRVASSAIQEVKILGSDYAKTTFTPTSGSSYSNYGGCYYEKYGRTVHVHLGVSGLTASTSATVFTLPSGYRPSSPVYAYGTGGAWNTICYVAIGTGGVIDVRSQGAYCGADITFMV